MSEKDNLLVALIDTYFEVWNESDFDKRRILLREIWFKHGEYIDPRADLKGVDELAVHIDKIQNGRPGSKIVRTSKIEVHHQIGRFKWQLLNADKMSLLEGLDIVFFTDDREKIKRIIGFFGEPELIYE